MGAADNPAGMFIAAGFSGHGFALGPAVGRLMSQLIRGLKPAVPLEPFKLQRFENAAVKPMSLSADMEQKIQRNDS
jgi:glycine/D-amino acid oxidase-like deaminating enzyme